jgi:GntR family transcriptional regulator
MSHMTVRWALNDLMQDAVIYSVFGKGMYVARQEQAVEAGSLVGFTEDVKSRGMKISSRVIAGVVSASTMGTATVCELASDYVSML